MKLYILIALQVLVFINLVIATEEEWKCETGVQYQENECNGCFCTETKLLGCTEKACEQTRYSQLRNCKVGTTWDKECNKCWCVKDLGSICTAKKC
ncbi:hypothetical protein ILUMI_08090 [Ignelater luminosus]|uniref:Protease inhibitor n=1 Tax=Ignelater luminosus TaxID=2038154 RepID=A0A8K0D288_IGNLU|nr:hypothetical protein ILUMI_08090 [Ignelater luminosus]